MEFIFCIMFHIYLHRRWILISNLKLDINFIYIIDLYYSAN